MREFYRLLSSLRLSTSTKRSLKSRDSVDFTTATDISAKRSAVPTLLLFVIRLINANSWSPWMVPPHRLSLPKRVRYYYATRRKFLVPEVSFDLTTARLSGEYLPIRSLWQNSLRNTRRSRDISINELLFSFSSFRRQQLSNPYCTDFAYRSSSFDEDQEFILARFHIYSFY